MKKDLTGRRRSEDSVPLSRMGRTWVEFTTGETFRKVLRGHA